MAADFNKPVTTDNYVDLLAMLRDNQEALARMFSGVTAQNIPNGSVRFNSGKFQTWNGSAWVDVPVSIDGGGTGAQSSAAARVALGTNNAANLTTGVLNADRVPGLDASKIVSGTLTLDTTGNAATATYATSAGTASTVTNGVYTTGNQSIGGIKTFSSDIKVSGTTVGLNGLPSSSGNVALGTAAIPSATVASQNTTVGAESLFSITTGFSNTAIGSFAGTSVSSGDNNTLIGYQSGAPASPFNVTTQSNRVVIGDNSVTNAYIKVAWTVTSDERDKTDIQDLPVGLELVRNLRPVAYQFKQGGRDSDVGDGITRYGFLAQQVLGFEGDNPVLVDTEQEENLKLKESNLIAVLIKAVQELAAEVDRLKSQNP